jgi:hypothetical protein
MERLYRITALVQGQDLDVPLELRDIPVLTYPFADADAHAWTFEERDFGLVPVLRDWLADQGIDQVTEEGMRRYSEQDSLTAKLVRLSGGELEELQVVQDAVIREDRCPDCGFVTRRISDKPQLRLRLPEGRRPELFWVNSACRIYVASNDLYQALKEDGLNNGLSAFPVEVEGLESHAYWGLYSTVDLGWPAAPYGLMGDVCPTCGRSVVRSPQAGDTRRYPGLPRYGFYLTFYHPDQNAHWMWTEVYGQSVLLMVDEVRDWLRHWDATTTDEDDSVRKPLNYHPLGWYPEEREQAFLDERYH